MPFKPAGKEHYYTRPTIRGERLSGKRSCGTSNKRLAEKMEMMLEELPLLGYEDLVDKWVQGEIKLPDLYAAKMNGRLDNLRDRLNDPTLRDVIAKAYGYASGRRVRDGVKHLERLSPKGVRLSWLMERKNLQHLIDSLLAEGQKPNSVARSLYQAIIEILDHELGKRKREEILFEVPRPYENDARDVTLTKDEIQRLADACPTEEFKLAYLASLLTGIDQTPQLRMQVRDFDPDRGTVKVPDTKTSYRKRTLVLSDPALAVFVAASHGKDGDDKLFDFSTRQLQKAWYETRDRAKLTHVRWKDLRHVHGDYLVRAGFGLREVGAILGHGSMATSLRYTASQSTGQRDRINKMAKEMGVGSILSVEKGGA